MPEIHKATPVETSTGVSTCTICLQHVKRVPGGQGSTWVHTESGAVVARGVR